MLALYSDMQQRTDISLWPIDALIQTGFVIEYSNRVYTIDPAGQASCMHGDTHEVGNAQVHSAKNSGNVWSLREGLGVNYKSAFLHCIQLVECQKFPAAKVAKRILLAA